MDSSCCQFVIRRCRLHDHAQWLLDSGLACPASEFNDALGVVFECTSALDALSLLVDHRAVQLVARYVNSKVKHLGTLRVSARHALQADLPCQCRLIAQMARPLLPSDLYWREGEAG